MTKVKLLLTGRQRGEDGEESVTKTCAMAEYGYQSIGQEQERGGWEAGFYILYDEIQEDTGAVFKNRIKLKSNTLELTRRSTESAHMTRMVFEPGKTHNVNYTTPFGCLKMEVSTQRVETSVRDGMPQVQAEYTLTDEGHFLSHCLLTIELLPV